MGKYSHTASEKTHPNLRQHEQTLCNNKMSVEYPQVVEYVAECGVLRALRIELTPWVLAGTQLVGRPLRALSWGAGLKIYDLRFTMN